MHSSRLALVTWKFHFHGTCRSHGCAYNICNMYIIYIYICIVSLNQKDINHKVQKTILTLAESARSILEIPIVRRFTYIVYIFFFVVEMLVFP